MEFLAMSDTTQSFLDITDVFNASNISTDNLNKSQNEWDLINLIKDTGGLNASSWQLAIFEMIEYERRRLEVLHSRNTCTYCEWDFRKVIQTYNSVHGYISLLICTIGVISNSLNVAVLTRKDMAASPINRLLKWLAVTDVFVMLEYIPFAVFRYLILPVQSQLRFQYFWAVYVLVHMHFGLIMHTVSICLTLTLAIWRYMAIKYSNKSHILCTEARYTIAIFTSFTLPFILCAPSFMVFKINSDYKMDSCGKRRRTYYVDPDYNEWLCQVNFWVHGVIMKLLPCFILTIISIWLIQALYSANRHQKNLRNNSGCPAAEKMDKRQMKADKRTDRTTKMLLAVLLLFLVTELPNGILGLMSGLFGWCFFKKCYDLFGELMDLLALLNGAITFVLYCSMSREFRQNFRQMIPQFKFNVKNN